MSKNKSKWSKDFAPSYTPKEMLEMGVFEGKYINLIKGLPKDWYDLPKVVGPDEDPDVSLNHYGVKSRQGLSVWQENNWIKTDEGGWFDRNLNYFRYILLLWIRSNFAFLIT